MIREILSKADPADFLARVDSIKYFHRGMIYSEAWAFSVVAEALGVTHIIESGTAYGRSTEIFGRMGFAVTTVDTANLKIYSVEENQRLWQATADRLRYLNNVKCIQGNSRQVLPALCRNATGRLAVIIDGPKGGCACELARLCVQYESVLMVGIHDQRKDKYQMSKYFDNVFYTDELWFRCKYGFLDKCDIDALNENGNNFLYDFPGFGLGIKVKESPKS